MMTYSGYVQGIDYTDGDCTHNVSRYMPQTLVNPITEYKSPINTESRQSNYYTYYYMETNQSEYTVQL